MLSPGHPFNRIADEEVLRITASQLSHLVGKPLIARSSIKYSQETESNALVMSKLIKQAGVLVRW